MTLQYLERGGEIEVYWTHITPDSGNVTLFSIVSYTEKRVSEDDVIRKETIHYGVSNPTDGSYFFGILDKDTDYLISVTQFVGPPGGTVSNFHVSLNTLSVKGPRDPSDELELPSPGSPGIVISQTSILMPIIVPETYFSNPPITSLVFNISSTTHILTRKFQIPSVSGIATGDTFLLEGLLGNTSYEIVCYGINSLGPGESSNTVVLQTTGIPPSPKSITSIVASLDESDSDKTNVKLTWESPDDDEFYDLTHYVIEYRVKNSSNDYVVLEVDENSTTHTIENFTDTKGLTYEFYISSKNVIGTSSRTGPTDVMVYKKSSAVNSLSISPTNTALTANWSEPSDLGGLSLKYYSVTIKTGGVIVQEVTTSSTSRQFTGLINGTNYTIEVIPVTQDVNNNEIQGTASSLSSVPFNQATKPVLEIVPGNEQVTLKWDQPDLEGGTDPSYEYQLNEGSWIEILDIDNTAVTDLSTTISYLTNGLTYKYRLRMITTNPNSSDRVAGIPSDQITLQPYNTPASVNGLTKTPSDREIMLNWTALNKMGGVDGLNIFYQVKWYNEANELINSEDELSSNSYILSGIDNGILFKFEVYSYIVPDIVNEDISTYSNSSNIEGYPYKNPGNVTNFGAPFNGLESTKMLLEWTPPLDFGGFNLYQYVLTSNNSFTVGSTLYSPGSPFHTTEDSVTVEGLTDGVTNNFSILVQTTNLNDTSLLNSGASSLSIASFNLSSSVQNLAIVQKDRSVDLTWEVPANNGGFTVEHYELVYRKVDSDGIHVDSNIHTISNISALTQTVSLLDNGSRYSFIVTPFTKPNNDRFVAGTPESIYGYPYKISSAPTDINLTPLNGEVLVRWKAPSDTGGFDVKEYEVHKSMIPDGFSFVKSSIVNVDGDGYFYYVWSTLTNGVTRQFKIRAVTTNLNSGADLYGSFTEPTLSSTPFTNPSPVQSLVVAPSDKTLTADWSAPANNGGFAITNYQARIVKIGVSGGSDDEGAWVNLSNTTTSYVFTMLIRADLSQEDLENGTKYKVQVRALSKDASNYESEANHIVVGELNSVDSIPYKLSEKPTGVNVVPGNGTLHVSWVAPLNTGGFDIVKYRIYLDNVLKTTFTGGHDDSLESLILELDNGTTYQVKVSTVTSNNFYTDDDGNNVKFEGEFSDLVSGKPYTNPEPVNNLQASPEDGKILVTFDYPSNNGGNSIVRADVTVNGHTSSANYADAINHSETFKGSLEVSGLTNGNSYDVVVVVVTKNSSDEDVKSIPANVTDVIPFGVPIITSYSINTATNEITVNMNNNGRLIIDVLVVVPSSNDTSVDNIISRDSDLNPISQTSGDLTSTYVATMSYPLLDINDQPILIVANNNAGMTYETNLT